MTFARVRSDEAWVDASTIAGGELAALDANLTDAINGDEGSGHAPTAIIQVAGAGVMVTGLWTLDGGASVQIDEQGSEPSPLTLADGDYPNLAPDHAGRSRTIATQLVQGYSNGEFREDGTADFPGARQVCGPLYVHHGARFASIVVTFAVSDPHAAVPEMPRFRVFALDTHASATSLLLGAPPNGWLPYAPKPTDPTTWGPDGYLSDGVKFHYFRGTIVPDTFIDSEHFTYWVDIADESGPNARGGYPGVGGGNNYIMAICSFVDILDLRPG